MKYTSGYNFSYKNNSIIWRSKKQTSVMKSTMETKYLVTRDYG